MRRRSLLVIVVVAVLAVTGVTIYRLDTALGSAALWNRDGLILVAAGCVSEVDLAGFVASVR